MNALTQTPRADAARGKIGRRCGPPDLGELETRLRAALRQAGQPYEGPLRYGEFIRYGDKGGKRPCWLIGQWLSGGHLAAVFGDWRQGSRHEFRSWVQDAALSQAEIYALQGELERCRRARQAAIGDRHARAARLAAALWAQLPSAGRHPYLQRKQVPPLGVRCGPDEQGRGPCLVIPLRTLDGALASLQFIYSDGRKRFLPGGAKQGACHVLGELDPAGLLYLAEGYATAVSVHLAIRQPVVVAFDAGNLEAVAAAFKRAYPDAQLVLAADNDRWQAGETGPDGKPKGNPGVASATAVARRYGARLAVPDFTGLDSRDRPTDFNDLARLAGLEAVKRQLQQASLPTWPQSSVDSVREEHPAYHKEARRRIIIVLPGVVGVIRLRKMPPGA